MTTLSALFLVCSHGRRSAHGKPEDEPYRDGEWCPGGRPATLEDLGGEKVWVCVYEQNYYRHRKTPSTYCDRLDHDDCGWQLLIPLPQMVAGESL